MGDGMGGSVVLNIASVGGMEERALRDRVVQRQLKAAPHPDMTHQLAYELAPKVRVNAIAPGLIRTAFSQVAGQPGERRWHPPHPHGPHRGPRR